MYKFKIEVPVNKTFCTKVWLLDWEDPPYHRDRDIGHRLPANLDHCIQSPWKWWNDKMIQWAKRKLVKRYERYIEFTKPDKVWEEEL